MSILPRAMCSMTSRNFAHFFQCGIVRSCSHKQKYRNVHHDVSLTVLKRFLMFLLVSRGVRTVTAMLQYELLQLESKYVHILYSYFITPSVTCERMYVVHSKEVQQVIQIEKTEFSVSHKKIQQVLYTQHDMYKNIVDA